MKKQHAILLNAFKRFSFPVDGIARLRNDKVAIGDRTVDTSGCNYGYIRTAGISTYNEAERIVACIDPLYEVSEQMFLNLLLPEGAEVERYRIAATGVLASVAGVRIQAVEVNKETIQQVERIPASLREVVRISFLYTYQDAAPCDTDLCEYVADIECAEECERPDFCERVKRCVPSLISTDEGNNLTVGSDGGLYATGGGGSSFKCEDLDKCQNFNQVKGLAESAVKPSDLATVATSGLYSDLQGLPSIPTLVSELTNDSSFQTAAQVTAAVNGRIRVFADYVGSAIGNSQTDAIMGVILIPANTFTNSAFFMMQVDFTSSKVNPTNNNSVKLLRNTSAATAGADIIAELNTLNTNRAVDMQRTIYSKAGVLHHFPNNVLNIPNDTVLQSTAWQTTNINWAVDQYFIFTGTTAAAETRSLIAAVIRVYQ